MRRLLVAALLLLGVRTAEAACTNRCDPVAACTAAAPCNWSNANSWAGAGGGVAGTCAGASSLPDSTTWLNFPANAVVTVDTNGTFCSDGSHNSFLGGSVLQSDGGRRTLTVIGSNGTQDLQIFTGSTFQLKGGDKLICNNAARATHSCVINFGPGAFNFYLDGTIGAEQLAGGVTNVGTTYTVSGISTTGFVVGDAIVWTSGAADSFWYEITALTSTSLTYQTDLPNASSLGLQLTPDQGTLGGLPSPSHSLPSIVPVAGDAFHLIAPVGLYGDGTNGGYWGWQMAATGAIVNAATNLHFNGVSIIGGGVISGPGAGGSAMNMRFGTADTGDRQFQFMNIGRLIAQDFLNLSGQKFGLNYVYVHDYAPGSTSTGGGVEIVQCTVGNCGSAFQVSNVFAGHVHGTRTTGLPLTFGQTGQTTNNDHIVIWRPTIHDGTMLSTSEADAIQCDDCDNSLAFGGRIWNWADPVGDGGEALHFGGDPLAGTSKIVNFWIVNGGDCSGSNGGTGWDVINTYCSNMRDNGFKCGGGAGATIGTMYGDVIANWSLATPTNPEAAINDCNAEGIIALGSASAQTTSYGFLQTSGSATALTVRNMLAKNYVTEGFRVNAGTTVGLTGDHLLCGGAVGGAAASCLNYQGTAAVTVAIHDSAADNCGGTGTSAWNKVAGATGTIDSITRNSTTATGCGAASANWTVTNEASAASLGFNNAAGNDYNLLFTSPLYRTGATPASSSRGPRCTVFDGTRLFPGVTFDFTPTLLTNELCHDADRDGYISFTAGTNSPDICPYVTDTFDTSATPPAGTCANGNTVPGKRTFP